MRLFQDKAATRRLYRSLARVYDIVYPLFAGPRRTRRRYYASLDLDAGDRVLDVGCGTGRSTRVLLDRTPNVDGIDLTPEQVGVAVSKPELAAARFAIGDAERLPYRDDTFDAVVSIGVLQHLPDPDAALREARRVAVDSGQLRLAVPKTPVGRVRAALADALAFTVTPEWLADACRRAGWTAVGASTVPMAWLGRDAVVVAARAGASE